MSSASHSYFILSNPSVFAHHSPQPSFVGAHSIYDATYGLSPRFAPPPPHHPTAGFFTPRYAASHKNQDQLARRRSDTAMPLGHASTKRVQGDSDHALTARSSQDTMPQQTVMSHRQQNNHIISSIITYTVSKQEPSETDPPAADLNSPEEQSNEDYREQEDIERFWMKQQENRMKGEQAHAASDVRHGEDGSVELHEPMQTYSGVSTEPSRPREQKPLSFHDKHSRAISHIKKTLKEVEKVIGPVPSKGEPLDVLRDSEPDEEETAVHTISFDEHGNLSGHRYASKRSSGEGTSDEDKKSWEGRDAETQDIDIDIDKAEDQVHSSHSKAEDQ
eukprot:283068-Hanusia_phi.AAC.1